MYQGIKIARIAGIDVILDWSLLLIFGLITVGLGTGVFPAWHPDWSPMTVWTTALAAAVLFFVSVLLHELSHALVGRHTGVKVRRIILFIFGGMAQMESDAPSWRAELAIALVGPVTSLLLGLLFILLSGLAAGPVAIDPDDPARALATLSPVATLLAWLGPINILLAVFNLVPGFPLDGGRALRAILWGVTGNLRRATRWASRGGQGFAWLLMACGVLMIFGVRLPLFGSGLVGGLWLAFIGWFLNNAAVTGYRQLVVNETLQDVPVERLMLTQFKTVAPDMRLQTLVDEHVMASGQRAFPVARGERFLGLVTLTDLQRQPREQWGEVPLDQVMTPRDALATAAPGDSASAALNQLGKSGFSQLPVVDGERLVGLVRREDVLKWLWLAGEDTDSPPSAAPPGAPAQTRS